MCIYNTLQKGINIFEYVISAVFNKNITYVSFCALWTVECAIFVIHSNERCIRIKNYHAIYLPAIRFVFRPISGPSKMLIRLDPHSLSLLCSCSTIWKSYSFGLCTIETQITVAISPRIYLRNLAFIYAHTCARHNNDG